MGVLLTKRKMEKKKMRKTIKEIADIQIGFQARSKIEPDPRGHYFIIQIKDFNGDRCLNIHSLTKFNPDRKIDRYSLCDKDIIFLSRGRNNFATVLRDPPANTVVAGYFYVLKLRYAEIEPEYVAWYINQPNVRVKLQGIARGTNIPLIPKADFENIEITIPSSETQNKIVGLSRLMLKEKELIREIGKQREQLVHAISFGAIMQDEDKKES